MPETGHVIAAAGSRRRRGTAGEPASEASYPGLFLAGPETTGGLPPGGFVRGATFTAGRLVRWGRRRPRAGPGRVGW
ncbi:hypothetical protein [Streptomyces nogalater]|uniref:hypothetical protein n=1 Tax=Streptomyces nogalater TaxID=38314 RepID=UPI0031D8F480